MLATPVRENGSQPMVGNYENEVHYTREEFMDELAKQLGQAYGLNDIRDAKWWYVKLNLLNIEEDVVIVHRILPQSMIIL